jgi:hypothetical protein
MPTVRAKPPSQAVQALLLKHLASMRASFVRDLMRDNQIKGLSNNKDKLLDLVRKALKDGELAWDVLIAFLDEREPNGKQRVIMKMAASSRQRDYSVAAIRQALENAGHGDLWNATVPIAAPDELQLSSVGVKDDVLHVVAIGRRTYRRRASELEGEVELPRDDLEVQLYEHVEVRAWVRAELDTRTGALNIRAVSFPQEKAQRELLDDFEATIASWFPVDLFDTLDLRKAIKALHDDECSGAPYEARVQAVGYDDASGRKTSMRSASANQSVNGASPSLQAAIDAVRASGEGADGNFFFLPTAQGGPANVPIGAEPVRVGIKAAAGQLDFTKPHEGGELVHVLHRIRVLAS